MSQHVDSISPPADQLMRQILHAALRLQQQCEAGAAKLTRLRERRQQDTTCALTSTQQRVTGEVGSAMGMNDINSLGGKLRQELARSGRATVRHVDTGAPPTSVTDAVKEWRALAPTAQKQVTDFVAAHNAWEHKTFKRAKSEPQVSDELWRSLDRLDLLHRSVQPLSQAAVADAVREASGAADVLIQAESTRQAAAQKDQARRLKDIVAAVDRSVALPGASWGDERWDSPAPPETVERLIRLGELTFNVPKYLNIASVPALLAFPFASGLSVGAAVEQRERAVGLLRSLLLRFFAAVPPGNLHVKVVDPVSLGQSVAEFRHLSEYDSQLMDEKTWTSERDIERLMDELGEHLEVVISRYLRGQFETIDEYNQHAGEVAEPYRIVLVFDYPAGFSDRASKQLLSIIENGPRCGVYTVLHYDTAPAQEGRFLRVPVERLTHSMLSVVFGNNGVVLKLDEPIGEIKGRLLPDTAPPISFDADGNPETTFAKLLTRIGTYVRRTLEQPPAVTLGSLLPVLARSRGRTLPIFEAGAATLSTRPETWWHASTAQSAAALLGRSGAQGVTSLHFSSTEVAGGAIMVGLPRSGKTTSLHAVILTLAMFYSPDELELYLIDAKHGVEFKVYENLPHARMVSVRSEREFSLAVLQSIEKEIRRRAELMKSRGAGAANITEYRARTGEKLSRILVVIDEFHELFEEVDAIGMAAFASFSNIVRMGPFSGAHIVVASQTLSNMPAMDRPTLTLLPQRVAFMCNEYDAEIVMGEGSRATRFLSKTGEGIFNPSRGEESRNEQFQGLYVPTEERTLVLKALAEKATSQGWLRRPRVFDGDAVVRRPALADLLVPGPRFTVPVGEPFTLATYEALTFARTRGANLLVVGDRDEEDWSDLAARGAVHSVLLAAQAQGVDADVVDFIGDDGASSALSIMDVAEATGAHYARSGGLDAATEKFGELVAARTSAEDYRAPAKLLILFGLQRALSLAPVDPYAYGDDAAPSLSSRLLAILTNGPEVGVHVVVDVDRSQSVEMRLNAGVLNEFTLRVAGSGADHKDLSFVSGDYAAVPGLRYGQLLIGDTLKGTTKRARGYMIITEGDR